MPDPLIKLAVAEHNIKDVAQNCETMCQTLYKYAGQDGHDIMNDSSYACACTPEQQSRKV